MTLPKEFCERMRALVGSGYDAFIQSYDTEINRGIRINPEKCADTAAVAAELGAAERVLWCDDGYYIDKEKINGSHPYHASGLIYFQEPSAMCAAEVIPIGARMLDLCAAPGGKTTQLAARMGNEGLLISNEIIQKRASVLSENVERMGLKNTIVTNEAPSRLAERFPNFFDGIVVDAPCSGEGMFRKEPQAAQAWSVEHTLSCATRQKNIIDDAYKMLKPGGYIMYSTCTFSIDENERVVEHMAERYGMEICDIPELAMLAPGIGGYVGTEKCRRIFPHIHKGEGHFAALLQKPDSVCDANAEQPRQRKTKNTALAAAVEAWREFEAETLNVKCEGEFVLFGDELYLMPAELDIDKLRVVRCGLHLGTVKKNRFVPAHALSHAFGAVAYKNAVELDVSAPELLKYMRGEVIPGNVTGWCVIAARGCGIGWGKASGGMVKNHYPKGLRCY